MGNDPGNCHIQSLADIHQGLSIQYNGGDKFIHKIAMRTAMSTGGDSRRQWRALQIRQHFRKALELSVKGSFLSPNASHLSA